MLTRIIQASLPARSVRPLFACGLATVFFVSGALGQQTEEFDPNDLTNPLVELPSKMAMPAPVPAGPVDPDLPQPFDPGSVQTAMRTLPFNRSVNMSESLTLTGIANINGKPVATLLDKETKKTYSVTEEPNVEGWKLEEIKPTVQLKFSQVKVNVGGEVVTIRNDQAGMEEALKKGKPSPGSTSPAGNGGSREEDRGFRRERRGPPPEVIERYKNLSDNAKDKLRKHFEEHRERITNMSPEERKAFMEKSFKKIAEDDESNRK